MPDLVYESMSDADLQKALEDIGFRMMCAASMETRQELFNKSAAIIAELERRGLRRA